jgi:hypothetical protein
MAWPHRNLHHIAANDHPLVHVGESLDELPRPRKPNPIPIQAETRQKFSSKSSMHQSFVIMARLQIGDNQRQR